MNFHSRFSALKWAICCGFLALMTFETVPSLGQNADVELMKRSTLVFIGTVVQMEAVSFSGVKASDKTAIVKVDRVLEKPGAVSLSPGDQITVELKDPSLFRKGVQATFYTDGWVLGDGVAVREVGHNRASGAVSLMPEEEFRKQLETVKLQDRIDSADLVVVGRVVEVRPAAVATPGPKYITEHDANYQEAIIQVESGLKGIEDDARIVVRFPASEDVAYYGIPKFKLDQGGVFLLRKDEITGLARATLAGAQVQAYIVQRSLDILPKEEADRVRTMISR